MKNYYTFVFFCVILASITASQPSSSESNYRRPRTRRNAAQVAEGVNAIVESAEKVIGLYDKLYDRVLPWNDLKKSIEELDKHREVYSSESSDLIGRIKTLVLNGLDQYFVSTQDIFEWCGLASQLLGNYLQLFNETSMVNKAFSAQREILMQVLDQGVDKMSQAQIHLGQSSSSFNDVSGKLVSLNNRFKLEFDRNSEFFLQKVAEYERAKNTKETILSYFSLPGCFFKDPSGKGGFLLCVVGM